MKIVVAGASGAVGQPAIRELIHVGHEVYGITRSEERTQRIAAMGAKPVVLDVLNKSQVFEVIQSIQPDVVIDLLSSLPKEYTPEAMKQAAPLDSKLRMEGGTYLQEAAEEAGVSRYVVQSCAFWYAPGEGLANETEPFAEALEGTKIYAAIEKRVLQSSKIEGVVLRMGFFYGPGTWFHAEGSVGKQLHRGEFPIIGKGEGVWNFVHVEDVAKAVSAAVYSATGAYNIVNNSPVKMRDWLPAFARYLHAPEPKRVSEEGKGADAVYYATKLRGASNAKAKEEFSFEPRIFEWML